MTVLFLLSVLMYFISSFVRSKLRKFRVDDTIVLFDKRSVNVCMPTLHLTKNLYKDRQFFNFNWLRLFSQCGFLYGVREYTVLEGHWYRDGEVRKELPLFSMGYVAPSEFHAKSILHSGVHWVRESVSQVLFSVHYLFYFLFYLLSLVYNVLSCLSWIVLDIRGRLLTQLI